MFYAVVILTFVFFASNLAAHTGTGSENTSCLCISYKMKLSFSLDMKEYLKLNIFCCYCLFPKNYAASESSKVLCFVEVFHCNFIFSGFFCIQANLTLCFDMTITVRYTEGLCCSCRSDFIAHLLQFNFLSIFYITHIQYDLSAQLMREIQHNMNKSNCISYRCGFCLGENEFLGHISEKERNCFDYAQAMLTTFLFDSS